MVRLRLIRVLCFVVMASCGDTRFGELTSSSDAIIGGQPVAPSGDPGVVALAARTGEFCSGSLIGPKTVLTAGHCISTRGESLFIVLGNDVSRPQQTVRVVRQVRHPQYSTNRNDYGLLQLETPVLNVPLVEMNTTPLSRADVGRTYRSVGFGVTNGRAQTGSGTKREVTSPVTRIDDGFITYGAPGRQTCQGDSGGPGFLTLTPGGPSRLAGVVSYGDQGCQQFGADSRVDVMLPWIRTTMAQWEEPTCQLDGACKAGCMPIDQDCACASDGRCDPACNDPARDSDCARDCVRDGVCSLGPCPGPDVDCLAENTFCRAVTQCPGRRCEADPQSSTPYCTRTCAGPADCQAGLECFNGLCRRAQKPTKVPLEVCTVGADFCLEGRICALPTGGEFARCVKPCDSNAECGLETCEAGNNGQRFCRPTGVSFSPVRLPVAQAPLPLASSNGCAATGWGPLALSVAMWMLRRRRAN